MGATPLGPDVASHFKGAPRNIMYLKITPLRQKSVAKAVCIFWHPEGCLGGERFFQSPIKHEGDLLTYKGEVFPRLVNVRFAVGVCFFGRTQFAPTVLKYNSV